MIIVYGHVTAKPDTIAEMTKVAREHVARSRDEPGCVSHEVTIDSANPLRLVFIERWEDKAALDTHFSVKENRAAFQKMRALAADPGRMQVFEAEKIAL